MNQLKKDQPTLILILNHITDSIVSKFHFPLSGITPVSTECVIFVLFFNLTCPQTLDFTNFLEDMT